MHILQEIVKRQKAGEKAGIYSCCSANEFVLKAAIERAKQLSTPVLIESTANQVDQFGGYTGMKPADFFKYVTSLADQAALAPELLILGGDHLGPLTFAKYTEQKAMELAEELVRQYVAAGFTKIHIDTSMRVEGDEPRLTDEIIAARGARLCAAAERAYAERLRVHPDAVKPVYVIGSEVPIPGGAQEAEEGVSVTRPEDFKTTYSVFKSEFEKNGLEGAFSRVIAVVVQPGVEFGDGDVFEYNAIKAGKLTDALKEYPNIIFEGHSTDYQTKFGLRAMVNDGIAILKVGPALTFALREGLFALENIERELLGDTDVYLSNFRNVLERSMLKKPANWAKHYHGDGTAQKFARAFSFSDRARYYLPDNAVELSVRRLIKNLENITIPQTLISQYMPVQYTKLREKALSTGAENLLKDRVVNCIDEYLFATGVI